MVPGVRIGTTKGVDGLHRRVACVALLWVEKLHDSRGRGSPTAHHRCSVCPHTHSNSTRTDGGSPGDGHTLTEKSVLFGGARGRSVRFFFVCLFFRSPRTDGRVDTIQILTLIHQYDVVGLVRRNPHTQRGALKDLVLLIENLVTGFLGV